MQCNRVYLVPGGLRVKTKEFHAIIIIVIMRYYSSHYKTQFFLRYQLTVLQIHTSKDQANFGDQSKWKTARQRMEEKSMENDALNLDFEALGLLEDLGDEGIEFKIFGSVTGHTLTLISMWVPCTFCNESSILVCSEWFNMDFKYWSRPVRNVLQANFDCNSLQNLQKYKQFNRIAHMLTRITTLHHQYEKVTESYGAR